MGAHSRCHPAYQVVPGCQEQAVQLLQSQGKVPDDFMDVPELQSVSVSEAIPQPWCQVAWYEVLSSEAGSCFRKGEKNLKSPVVG